MGGTAGRHTVLPCFFVCHLAKGFNHLRIDFVLGKLAMLMFTKKWSE